MFKDSIASWIIFVPLMSPIEKEMGREFCVEVFWQGIEEHHTRVYLWMVKTISFGMSPHWIYKVSGLQTSKLCFLSNIRFSFELGVSSYRFALVFALVIMRPPLLFFIFGVWKATGIIVKDLKLDAIWKKGKGNKIATQVVQIVYVSCALLNDNLQVPYSVLYLIYMHRWLTLCYFVYLKMIAPCTLLHACDSTPSPPKPKRNKAIKQRLVASNYP